MTMSTNGSKWVRVVAAGFMRKQENIKARLEMIWALIVRNNTAVHTARVLAPSGRKP